jgi:ribose 5-phosphate isomerase RpiB
VVTPDDAVEIARTWLETPIEGERHQRRLDQIAARECGETLTSPRDHSA